MKRLFKKGFIGFQNFYQNKKKLSNYRDSKICFIHIEILLNLNT